MMPTLIVSVPMLPTSVRASVDVRVRSRSLDRVQAVDDRGERLDAHAVLELDQAEDVGVQSDERSHQLGVLTLVLHRCVRTTALTGCGRAQSLPPSSSVRK